ncbi:MAG: hypothetical protein EBU31_16455, partial [Proteobacteria bacterium]|nr:hypothetical protein [Pseudomonadota bacterium]
MGDSIRLSAFVSAAACCCTACGLVGLLPACPCDAVCTNCSLLTSVPTTGGGPTVLIHAFCTGSFCPELVF